MQEVDHYYQSRNYHANPKLYSEYKKWNRWAWYAVRHLNESGEVDYKSQFYFDEAQRMQQNLSLNIANSNTGIWGPVGPITTTWAINRGSRGIGRVNRLAFYASNSSVILAATPAGGLFRTNDAGFNWFSISPNVPNCGISGVLFGSEDPSGNTIYILTGDGDTGPVGSGAYVSNYGYLRNSIGVLVTYNGGFTWNVAGNSRQILNRRRCYKLLQVRNAANRLLAATDTGIYSSSNYGASWALSSLAGSSVFDIEQHPAVDTILYASLPGTVMKSIDRGQTFTINPAFNPVQNSATRTAIAVTAVNANEVYYLQSGNGYNRIYRSTDNGNNYTSINTTDLIAGQYTYNCSFAVNPQNNNFIVTGGINISSSSNNGASFPNTTVGIINNTIPDPTYVHSDIHDLAYNPLNNALYAATDGGIYFSTDNGVNWIERSIGLQCTQYYHMDGSNGVTNLLVGGAQDNGTAFTTNGANMNYCGAGDGFAVDFINGNNDIFYLVENTSVSRFVRSTNTRTTISPGTAANQSFFPNVISHPTNNNIVYVGYSGSMWRSDNQGGNWTQISANGTSNGGGGQTGGFAVSAQTPDRLYAANANTVWRSDNQGNNWVTISGNTGWPANFGVITDLASRNNNANEIWAATTGNNGANRVLYSGDAGANWTDLTGSLSNIPVYSIVYSNDGDAYIGTELGVYFMDFNMNDWVPFYNGMPMVPVSDLFINETNGNIQAATFGRGIWNSDLYTDCNPFLVLSGTTEGRRFFQASGFIETTQQIPGSAGNDLRYRSPVRISLKPGFSAGAGSTVRAVIGPCGQGVPAVSFTNNDTKAEAIQLINRTPQ